MQFYFSIVSLVGLMLSIATVIDAREWTDHTGKHTIEAELIEFKDGKVRLKRTNGKEITLPFEKLSQADQDFLTKKPATEAPAVSDAIKSIKQGDMVYVNSNGLWYLATVTGVEQTAVGPRFKVMMKDSSRSVRVSQKRIRPIGMEATEGSALPGDKVKVRINRVWQTATLIELGKYSADVQLEGSTSKRSVNLSDIAAPSTIMFGAGDYYRRTATEISPKQIEQRLTSVANLVNGLPAVRQDDFAGVIPGEIKRPNLGVARPMHTRGVSLADVDVLPIPDESPTSINLGEPWSSTSAIGRSGPIRLAAYGGVNNYLSVSADGKLAAVLVGSTLELIDMTTDGPSTLIRLPAGTDRVALSPDGTRLLSGRTPRSLIEKNRSYSRSYRGGAREFTLWRIVDGNLEAEDSFDLGTLDSDRSGASAFSRPAARWLNNELILFFSSSSLMQWNANTGSANWKLHIPGNRHFFGPNNKYIASFGRSYYRGITFIDPLKGTVEAVVGAGKCRSGALSISPSGKYVVIGDTYSFQLWDLNSGEEIVWALNPPENKSSARWTGSEYVLQFGEQFVDLRTMSLIRHPASDDRFYGQQVAGYFWKLEGPPDFDRPSAFRRNVAARTLTVTSIDLSNIDAPIAPPSLPTLLKPGDGIALVVQVAPSIQAETYEMFQKRIEAAGFHVDDSADVKFIARTRQGEAKSATYGIYNGLFASRFFEPDEVVTVYWHDRHYDSVLEASGQPYFTLERTFSDPGSPRLERDKTLQQVVAEYFRWRAGNVLVPPLANYIYPMQAADAELFDAAP